MVRAFSVVAVVLLIGCAGYQLGPTNGVPAGSKSIQINLFKNDLLEPRLSEAVATSLRRTVQQDGTYQLDTHGDADIIVTGVMTRLDRSALSFQASDILTPRDYGLTVTARIDATEARSGKTIFSGTVNGHTTVRAAGDLVAAERQALPLLAEDLARNITSKLVDGTW
ncbi:MAG: hypothetical protein JWM99_3654 [Verrucomicrobiales bacterium]|nr:hypothetical protein [Verrucomicrobiales bacterium]